MPMPSDLRRARKIVAVAGGKGGVGKSCVAVNTALALGQLGHRVVLVDCDLGAANLHTMFGITRPPTGLGAFLDDASLTLADVTVETEVPTVRLVPGTSRVGAADLGRDQKLRVLRGIARLDADIVMIDIGAGTSYTALDLVSLADVKMMVLTPQLTSLQNAYAFLKGLVHRTLRRLPDAVPEQAMLDRALATDGEGRTIPQVIGELRVRDPILARRIEQVLCRLGVVIAGNMLARDGDEAVLARVSTMITDKLAVSAPVIGTIRQTPAVPLALAERRPVVLAPVESAAAPYRRLASALANIDARWLRGERGVSSPIARQRTIPLWIERDELPAAG